MASPAEKLAESLEVLHNLHQDGVMVIQSKELSRTHREHSINHKLKSGILISFP